MRKRLAASAIVSFLIAPALAEEMKSGEPMKKDSTMMKKDHMIKDCVMMKDGKMMMKGGFYVLTWDDLLRRTKTLHWEFLNTIKERAPADDPKIKGIYEDLYGDEKTDYSWQEIIMFNSIVGSCR